MKRVLRRKQFGNPILRQKTAELSEEQILSEPIQELIGSMRHTLENRKYGVGLAAPQVGHNICLSVIHIRPTKTRPNLPKAKWADLVIINPKIIKTYGAKIPTWEGCISLAEVFAKVSRYKKVELEYLDENAMRHKKIFNSLLAQVIQHEIDHLHSILFVDKVKDTSTFMSGSEYRKRIVSKNPTGE
ncbi:peptide deformylase [Candidatus Saccharibacteria bacterium]|nr:peptide deformylase [Candidatus Saccharibacteria bacterium]